MYHENVHKNYTSSVQLYFGFEFDAAFFCSLSPTATLSWDFRAHPDFQPDKNMSDSLILMMYDEGGRG
jgi:hypothetical protein